MSNAETLLNRLLAASNGVSTSERQAEARVKTNDYFDTDKKELKGEALLAALKGTEAQIQGLRATVTEADNSNLVEVYDASLSVFTKWANTKDAA